MMFHQKISESDLRINIRKGEILYGGNHNLRIYGMLNCASGKRLKKQNRVFFQSENEATILGYRPCGHCMKVAYKKWKMGLLDLTVDKYRNWLPKDGTVNYYGKLLLETKADYYFQTLLNTIEWKHDEANIFGKKIITKREVAWYGEKAFEYNYSNSTKYALPWTPELLELKAIVENEANETFNSCLLNLYHSGEEGMAWHSDGETDLKKNGAIASFSLGAERKFSFKHKWSNEKIELMLQHGSLMVMKNETQTYWLHRLPPSKGIKEPRINLTFRTIVE
ncbi:alpha-ketoglutarate-dependent dioxygenase AlkB [Aquiflexum lacus]|uniref:alpha-ketoglutarate-dependent dioxygenase AlkB n=1 Tax=Aquiflexum lacus TaxID=2483805 RepID=UPI001893726E|nr:alpha-ketoglutarate-dependent dioxygenase AlkB [Aquiflexum lacus]